MKSLCWSLILAVAALVLGCRKPAAVDSLATTPPKVLDVNEVMASKESLFDREIVIKGFLALDFENINLYQSFKDYRQNTHHCVTVGVNDLLQREGKKHDHKEVVIRGLLVQDYVENGTICLSCCTDYAILPVSMNSK